MYVYTCILCMYVYVLCGKKKQIKHVYIIYSYPCPETHAELMFIVDPYEKADRFDPYLGEIAIGSTVWAREFILVQKPINWTVQEEYSSPLWVSTFRQPFRQAQFPLKSQEEVSLEPRLRSSLSASCVCVCVCTCVRMCV